jgi:hypothetical protein
MIVGEYGYQITPSASFQRIRFEYLLNCSNFCGRGRWGDGCTQKGVSPQIKRLS